MAKQQMNYDKMLKYNKMIGKTEKDLPSKKAWLPAGGKKKKGYKNTAQREQAR